MWACTALSLPLVTSKNRPPFAPIEPATSPGVDTRGRWGVCSKRWRAGSSARRSAAARSTAFPKAALVHFLGLSYTARSSFGVKNLAASSGSCSSFTETSSTTSCNIASSLAAASGRALFAICSMSSALCVVNASARSGSSLWDDENRRSRAKRDACLSSSV